MKRVTKPYTFYGWLMFQTSRDDLVGDFARDVKSSPATSEDEHGNRVRRPHGRSKSPLGWRRYLGKLRASEAAIESMYAAWAEYQVFLNKAGR